MKKKGLGVLNAITMEESLKSPFFITNEQTLKLHELASEIVPSPLIFNCKSFNDFVSQLMIPSTIMELMRKASGISLSHREIDGY